MEKLCDLPEEAVLNEQTLITPCGFCLFEEPIVGDDLRGGRTAINGLAWNNVLNSNKEHEMEKMLLLYFLVDPNDTQDTYNDKFIPTMQEMGFTVPPISLQHFYPTRYDRLIKSDRGVISAAGSTIIMDTIRVFLAMQLLAQQRMGEPIRIEPSRPTRRRAAKWHEGDRYITLITLRRKSVKKDDEEPQKIEWSHRWMVQGHWRKQYYPSTKTHEWVYIFGYVKGPEDKPLVIRERRVFNFRR